MLARRKERKKWENDVKYLAREKVDLFSLGQKARKKTLKNFEKSKYISNIKIPSRNE